MWTTCYLCLGNGIINNDNNMFPCYKCNFTNSIVINFNDVNMIMIGQLWVDDCIEPITQPSSPKII